jgi:hypothetical protein
MGAPRLGLGGVYFGIWEMRSEMWSEMMNDIYPLDQDLRKEKDGKYYLLTSWIGLAWERALYYIRAYYPWSICMI